MADLKKGKAVPSLDYSLEEAADMAGGEEKALVYLSYALYNQERHHKQWFIEEALKALGYSLKDLARKLDSGEHMAGARAINPQAEEFAVWERGIAP